MNEHELLYARTHEWLHLSGDVGTIGITRFAVDQLTDLVFVELPEVGRVLNAGDSFGVVESVKAVSDLYVPVAGEVIDANQAIVKDPSLLGVDPFGKGWLIKIRIPAGTDTSHLLSKAQYDQEIVTRTVRGVHRHLHQGFHCSSWYFLYVRHLFLSTCVDGSRFA